MTLKEIYEEVKAKPVKRVIPPTPSQAFVSKIAKITKKSELAVRRWLGGQCTPDALTQEVLAKHFNTTPDKLFPKQSAND